MPEPTGTPTSTESRSSRRWTARNEAGVLPPRLGRIAADPVAACVLLALTVHAVAGEPTPDRPAAAAAVTAGLLVLALGGGIAVGCRQRHRAPCLDPPWTAAGLGLLVLGLGALPALAGALRGWPLVDILRDLIGLGALAAPIVLFAAVAGRADPARAAARLADAVVAGLVLVGIGHALRFLVSVDATPGTLGIAGGADGDRYLVGDPAVVFAAVLLGGRAVTALQEGPRSIATTALPAMLAAAPCVLVLAMTLQRAPLAAVTCAMAVFVLRAVLRRPTTGATVGLVAACGALIAVPALGRLVTALADKTRTVGANHRIEEIAAVVEMLAGEPLAALLGQGWGALIALPAIADAPVSFVHALPLYLLWKTGPVGLALGVAWLALLARPVPALMRHRPLETAAVLAALALSITVQPGFKTLSFAMILAWLLLRSTHDRR